MTDAASRRSFGNSVSRVTESSTVSAMKSAPLAEPVDGSTAYKLTARCGDLAHTGSPADVAGQDLSAGQTKNHIGVTVGANVLPPDSIERSVGKARCLVDQRPKE